MQREKCFFEAPNFECGDVVRREAKLEPCAPTESGKAIADLVTQPDATSEMPENVNTQLNKKSSNATSLIPSRQTLSEVPVWRIACLRVWPQRSPEMKFKAL